MRQPSFFEDGRVEGGQVFVVSEAIRKHNGLQSELCARKAVLRKPAFRMYKDEQKANTL